jgi:hypothetical protein
MTPEYARDALRRFIQANGEMVTLRRTNQLPTPATEVSVMARIMGYSPEELASGVMQGNRKAIMLAEDVEASGFPVPILKNTVDSLVVRGGKMTIKSVDDSTRRVGGVLIGYNLDILG